MATIRLVPSTYVTLNSSGSSVTYLTVSNASNMYTDTDSTTYATITNSRTSTTSYFIYLRGFNFDDIPDGAVVNSFSIKVKAYESDLSTSTAMYLANGTTQLSDSATAPTTSTTTRTFSSSTSWDTIIGYGSNFGIKINCGRSNRNTSGSMYIYGAEIYVDYTIPIQYTITSTITNGTITSTNPTTVYEGNNSTITFTGNGDYLFKSMTVNGISVTPSIGSLSTTATATYSTNYSIYNSNQLAYAFDDDTSNCFWSSEVQASGKYILINYDNYINLNSFTVTTTGSSTDYICSGTSLQVSSDGGSTWTDIGTFSGQSVSSFTNLNQTKINAIRIYWNSGVDYWLYIDQIDIDYTVWSDGSSNSYYYYTINSVDSDQTVIIIFGPDETYYVKIDGTWTEINKIYIKTDGVWTLQDSYDYSTVESMVYQGNI